VEARSRQVLTLTLWWIPVVAVNVAKAERARFSHALTAEVKNIFHLRGATIAEGGSASPKTM
jgi:hypothetical protein